MKRPIITSVSALKKYIIEVCFDDGTRGVYDLKHMAGRGVFQAWDEQNNFFDVFISQESGAITWPGELDIDSVTAYCAIKQISVDDYLNPSPTYAAY